MAGRPATVLVSTTPRVKSFLNSISRNSRSTMKSYASALVHLENFIKQEYPGYDCSSIIEALAENKINIYRLLDGFISYIQSVRVGITPKSVRVYMTALRSYFAYHDIDVIPSKFKGRL
jgi:integrase